MRSAHHIQTGGVKRIMAPESRLAMIPSYAHRTVTVGRWVPVHTRTCWRRKRPHPSCNGPAALGVRYGSSPRLYGDLYRHRVRLARLQALDGSLFAGLPQSDDI